MPVLHDQNIRELGLIRPEFFSYKDVSYAGSPRHAEHLHLSMLDILFLRGDTGRFFEKSEYGMKRRNFTPSDGSAGIRTPSDFAVRRPHRSLKFRGFTVV